MHYDLIVNRPMRRIVCCSFLAVLLAACSCGEKSEHIIIPVKEISFADQDRPWVEPTRMDYCPMGIRDMISYDKYLFIMTSDKNAYLKVYDMEKGAEVAALCSHGRAGNEFNYPLFFTGEAVYTVDGEIMLPLMEEYSALKEINITRSIEEQRTVINRTVSLEYESRRLFTFIDNDFTKVFMSLHPYHPGEMAVPVRFYIKDPDGGKTEIPVFKDLMNGENQFFVSNSYSGCLIKHPRKNVMVYSMAHFDYLIFFDLDNNKTFAIHQKGTDTFEKEVVDNPGVIHFAEATVSNDYYFSTYLTSCTFNNPDAEYGCELLAFDWKGNYVGGFRTKTELQRFAYSEKTQTLFCANFDEEILYTIPVKEILKK